MNKKTFFGREAEKKELLGLLKSATRLQTIFLSGEQGIGKTALIQEIENISATENQKWIWLYPDSEHRRGFDAIIEFLKTFFAQNPENTKKENLRKFKDEFAIMIELCSNDLTRKELIRTESFLAALLNLSWKNSLFGQVDSKLKYENTLLALKSFFLMFSFRNKLVLTVDNAAWLDENSREFFEMFVRHNAEVPLNLIFIDSRIPAFGFSPTAKIYLSALAEKPSLKMISALFPAAGFQPENISFDDKLFIYNAANGNPFYIEQIVAYSVHNKLFGKDGKLKIDQLKTQVDKIADLRISQLDENLKNISKKASVLGNRFTVRVLNTMMSSDEMNSVLQKGENDNLWFSVDDFERSFSNSIIRRSIYYSMMKDELVQLHKLAAESIENIYRENLKPYYGELAENYLKAEEKARAIFYLQKAGNYAKELYRNAISLRYFQKLFALVLAEKKYGNLLDETVLDIIEMLLLINDTTAAAHKIKEYENYNFQNGSFRDRYFYLHARLFSLTENYSALKNYVLEHLDVVETDYFRYLLQIFYLDSLRFLNETETFENETEKLLIRLKNDNFPKLIFKLKNNFGIYFLQKARYQEALKTFSEIYKISRQNKDKNQQQQSLHHLGVVNSRLGNRQEALRYYHRSFKLAEEIGNLSALGKISSNIATVFGIEGKVDKALEFYRKALKISRSVGSKFQEELILYNIGELYCRTHNYDKSLEYLQKSKIICEEISDKIGITYADEMNGDILFAQGKIAEAKKIYLQNLELQKELNESEGIAHSYGNLGNVFKREKKYRKAKDFYQKQRQMLAEIGDKEGEGNANFNWGTVEMEERNFNDALLLMENALSLYTACSNSSGIKLAKEQIEIIRKKLHSESNNAK